MIFSQFLPKHFTNFFQIQEIMDASHTGRKDSKAGVEMPNPPSNPQINIPTVSATLF